MIQNMTEAQYNQITGLANLIIRQTENFTWGVKTIQGDLDNPEISYSTYSQTISDLQDQASLIASLLERVQRLL